MNSMFESLEDRRLMSVASPIFVIAPTSTAAPVDVVQSRGKGAGVKAEAGEQFTSVIASLPRKTVKHLTQLSGTIDWGDGSDTTDATFERSASGRIAVVGAHTYSKTGKFSITVTLFERPPVLPGQPNPFFEIQLGQIMSKATVTAEHDGGVSLTEIAGKKFTQIVGSLDQPTVDTVLTAKIDWGDGQTTSGKLKLNGSLADGEWDVIGSHTYTSAGDFQVHVVVSSHMVGSPQLSGTAADFFSSIKVV